MDPEVQRDQERQEDQEEEDKPQLQPRKYPFRLQEMCALWAASHRYSTDQEKKQKPS